VVGSARGAVSAFRLVRFLWPPSRTGRASWPRIRLSAGLVVTGSYGLGHVEEALTAGRRDERTVKVMVHPHA
jgi:hypothetical protein